MDGRENGRGRVIGSELRCIPRRFLEPCWGMKWTTKCCPRGPSDYDTGVLTSDGIYLSLKNLLVVEYGNLDPSPSLATGCDSRSWHLSLSTLIPSMYERTQDQPDIMHSDDTPVHSSVHLIAPGRMEGHTTTPSIPITGTGRASSIQSLSEPYMSELSFALLPGHSSLSSQSYGTPTVGTPKQLPHPSQQNIHAVSQARGGPLYNAAPENSASARCISAQAADAQHYLRPTISSHSTPQVHLIAAIQTPQTTFTNSWDDLDFPVTSVTPTSCSTSFSPDCALIGELEQHHGSGFTIPSLDLKEQPQSNDLLEEGVMDEYWQLNCGGMRLSPMYLSRELSPIDMGVYELPGISEGDGTANNFYDACLFSNSSPVTFGR